MRAIDGDALEKYLSDAEIEATRQRKYVFASALNTICGNVRNFPTIEPERKKGEWIEISKFDHSYKCSICGRTLINITDGKNTVAKNYPFCHCGADMRGVK